MVSRCVVVLVVAMVFAACFASDVPGIKYVKGGISGEGHATRYWDCCKPSCSWTQNAVHTARSCEKDGKIITDANEPSAYDGGKSTTCLSQVPFAVNDDLAYAFAAVPAFNGGKLCGRCFDLEFTGEGKYETKSVHKALKGKHLIVMASNIGGDVAGGQFDIMIPGGGVGIYDACSKVGMPGWGSSLGAQYGGLLSDCESESNWDASKYQSCLIDKCNSVFSGNEQAKQGCLFLANWMKAAGNPLHTYREVECPAALKDRY